MDEQTFDAIMADIADGQPMRQAALNASVSRRAVWYAINATPERMHKYAGAKESMIEAMADDTAAIGDDQSIEPNSRRIMVDTRKWLLSKMVPKRFGDKLELAGDAAAPLVINITGTDSKL